MASEKKKKKVSKQEQKAKQGRLIAAAAVIFMAVGITGIVISTVTERRRTAAASSAAQSTAGKVNAGDLIVSAGDLNVSHYADVEIEDYGTVTLALDRSIAPATVDNFVKLAESGFYDGLTFHRIMDGFMIQGGDPNGDGTGGSEETIKGEFSENGVENPISHVRGAVSMARSQDMDSASSQFFIVQADSTFLDGSYAGFGFVTEGMDVVDRISGEAKPTDNNGTIPKDQQPVIKSITIREA